MHRRDRNDQALHVPSSGGIHFVDKPRVPCHRIWGFPEKYGFVLDRVGFVGARPKAPTQILIHRPKPRPPVARPSALVPDFYLDPKTKLLSCFTRSVADIEEDRLIAELEAEMKKTLKGGFDWKQEYLGEFQKITIDSLHTPPSSFLHYAKDDATATGRLCANMKDLVRNLPSPRYARPIQGVRADRIIFDSEISFKELELRTLALLEKHERDAAGLGDITFHILKNRDRSTTCRPTTTDPQLPIFQPSPPASTASAARASVIPRLLADSVSKKPLSIGE